MTVWAQVGDLEVELASLCVPVERKVTLDVLHAGGFAGDGLRRKCGERECGDGEESQGQMFGHASVLAHAAPAFGVNQGRVMVGSLRCSRRRRWVRVLRSSPVLGRAKAWAVSDQSSLKLVACAEIQT